MRRFLAVAAVVMLGVLAAGSTAQGAVTVNVSSPIAFNEFVSCANGGAGEFVSLSGNLHVLLTYTINGNNVSGKGHFQPQGISGTGLTTGDKYRGTGVYEEHFKSSFQNGQSTSTLVDNYRFIGQGPGNNFLVHSVTHVTVNANGDATVSHSIGSIECK